MDAVSVFQKDGAMDDIDWIRKGLEKPGKSQTGLADALSRSPSAVTNLLKGKRRLIAGEIPTIAAYLGVDAPEQPNAGGYRAPPDFIGARDLKVFAAVEAGPGEMVVSTEPIELVPRPWYMREVRDGYAVLVVGESMIPRYQPGELAIVNPRLPPMRDKDVILVGGEHEGEFRASIKRLLGWDSRNWRLLQYNGPKGQPVEFSWPKKDWPKALRVVGKYDGN